MKKIIGSLFLITLILSVVACTTENKEENTKALNENSMTTEDKETKTEDGKYKDGVYKGVGDPWEYGSEDSNVVIKDGKITDITLRRLDAEGNEVNYEEWAGQEKDGKTYPNLKQYRVDLAKEMVETQTYEVDSISGATVSSDNWKMAVKRALEKAQ